MSMDTTVKRLLTKSKESFALAVEERVKYFVCGAFGVSAL